MSSFGKKEWGDFRRRSASACFATGSALAVLLMAQGQAQDFTYTTYNGTVTITAYQGPSGAVAIPSTLNGLPVTAIGAYAFRNLSSLSSVTIPNGVTNIGDGSFMFCGLTNFDLPDTITNLGQMIFYGCEGLTSVTIPNSVTNLGVECFGLCSGLTNVTLGNGLSSIGEGAFFGCGNLPTIGIPGSVTSISDGAFSGCSGLKTLTLPSSATNFEGNVFSNCGSLTSMTLPEGITNIGWGTFAGCTSLTNVTIPDSVTSIADEAFIACTSLTNLLIPRSVTNIGHYAFVECSSLTGTSVDPRNPVYSTADGTLFDKTQKTLVGCAPGAVGTYNIPNGITNIGPDAFGASSGVSGVTIPDSITNIGVEAFSGFHGQRIVIPNRVVNISTNAFVGCALMYTITIGSGVTNIEDSAFDGCTNLHSAFFLGNAPPIGNDVFFNDLFATIYYLPQTTGWGPTLGGRPTTPWNPQAKTNDASFGVQQNRFGFNITGMANIPLVVEASTNGAAGPWVSLQNYTLANGSIYFSDPQWTNYPSRFYRIRSP
jgi:hypothetical protein